MTDPLDEKRIPDGGMQLPDPGQLQPEDTLLDRGTDPSGADGDPLDEGYTEPERPIDAERWLNENETIEDRIREEEPDPTSGYGPPTGSGIVDDERPDATRTGRLVAPDEGSGSDDEAQEVASDAGFAGGGASAEEAAMHATAGEDTMQGETDPALRDPEVQAELDEIDEELRHNDG